MSESQFKTTKYQPSYPRSFDNYNYAMIWCEHYVHWYNHVHHNSSLASLTPRQLLSRKYQEFAQIRQAAQDDMYELHTERFKKGCPVVQIL